MKIAYKYRSSISRVPQCEIPSTQVPYLIIIYPCAATIVIDDDDDFIFLFLITFATFSTFLNRENTLSLYFLSLAIKR